MQKLMLALLIGVMACFPAISMAQTSDLSKIKTKAECEKAGGMWQETGKKCEAKKK